MRRLLILGIAITAFAFSLFLMNCGPVANNNAGGNSAGKPATPLPGLDHNPCQDLNPQANDVEAAIRKVIEGDDQLKNHYNHDHPEIASMDFHVYKDGAGLKMKVEGNMAHIALSELMNVMQSFAGDKCVRRVIFVSKTNSKAENENANADPTKIFDPSFEWDLTCQDPSHPCSDGSCQANGVSCPAYKGNSNTNANGGGNTNSPVNTSPGTNRQP